MAWFAVGPNRKDQLLRVLRLVPFVVSDLVASRDRQRFRRDRGMARWLPARLRRRI